ncbi:MULTISPECIES: IclR family transcriptional regulator [unclassified Comamonas]|jgi:DNA-binding IclR family transcriptional regulator|uniref:IclR family transcriptional regulator n=1 Tax=unclassified Comamonas TaxID=2638500 RepID=UPI001784FA9D|nr:MULTISPECIES: IclR family transcriptional regulator [unclassified Comamonas]MBD9402214.1 IclR family transcriptional regulator [Comamonas sp. CMM02]
MTADLSKQRKVSSITLPGLINPHDLALDRQFAMTLARGLEVLRAFTATNPVLSNREIADRTGLPKPTVSRLSYTLGLLGYISKDADTQKYRLASGVLALGHPLLASMKTRQLAKPLMAHIARQTGCTVNLGLRDRTDIVYVDSVRADGRNEYLPDIGSTYPLLVSSMGHVLIHGLARTQKVALLNYLKVQDSELFSQYSKGLEEDEKRFNEQGYCLSSGAWDRELYAIAVPLKGAPGEPPLSMNGTLYAHRNARHKLVSEVLPLLKQTAYEIETSYGLHPG